MFQKYDAVVVGGQRGKTENIDRVALPIGDRSQDPCSLEETELYREERENGTNGLILSENATSLLL
jgi:hypothetical protein